MLRIANIIAEPHWSDDRDPAVEARDEAEFMKWLASKAHTHTGYKPHTGHTRRSSYLSGHTDPKPGRVHALNRVPGRGYVALCGERVPLIAEDVYGNEVTDHVQTGGTMTCKRCLAKLVK